MRGIEMAGFYKVHCTNCGKVLDADKMAVDVDKILKMHLSRVVGRNSNPVMTIAKKAFDEIRVGMYLTKFQMVNDGILSADGTLHLTCRYILDFIQQRYRIELTDIDTNAKNKSKEYEDSFEADLDDWGRTVDEHSWEDEEDDYDINPKLLDELCFKMKLYAQVDNAEEVKRNCISEMLRMLLDYGEVELMECACSFMVQKDDRDQEFISSLKVTYVDGETVVYNHMVCPDCGETFFIDAGRYEEHIIVMLGSSRVGKTAYLAALVDEINPEYGQSHYPRISIKDTLDRRFTYFRDNILKQYRCGKKISKTDEQKESAALFSLDVFVNGRMVILTFVDLPGEVFIPRSDEEKQDGVANGRFIINYRKICASADVFWFCIDPVQIDQRLHRLNEEADKSDRVEQDMEMVLSNIENALNIMGGGKANAPAAIIITKSDLITPDAGLCFKDRGLEPQCLSEEGYFRNDLFRNMSKDVCRYMCSNNVKNLLPKLDNMFENKNYFAVAAYGIKVDKDSKGGDKSPSAIILPFLWSLSVLNYLTPVEYEQRTEKTGVLRRQERFVQYYNKVEQSKLFAVER